jgi:hypothetical protein
MNSFWKFILINLITLVIHLSPLAMEKDSSNVSDDITKIESLVKKLREIDCDHFSQDARKLLMAEHLDFLGRSEAIARLYRNVCHKVITENGCNHIWQATLAEDRPQAGLRAGDMIAVKMQGSIPKPFKHSLGMLGTVEPLIRLSHFKNLKTSEQPITDYFPNFYGVYYAEKMPESIVEGTYPELLKNYKFETAYFRYEEMEWVDTTFAKKYTNSKIPDSVLFELMYGEWAGQFFVGLAIGDCKGDNYGLKVVSYHRIYHLGNDVYAFSSTEMPVRLDLEEFTSFPHPTEKKFGGGKISTSSFAEVLKRYAESQSGKDFLDALYKQEDDLFALFKKYFSAYQIDPEKADYQAKHFYLDQKWIDQERSLLIQ